LRYHDGGYGSAIAADPNRAGYYYLLRDVDARVAGARATEISPIPPGVPAIGLFRFDGNQLAHVADVSLRHSDASEFAGNLNRSDGAALPSTEGAAVAANGEPSGIAGGGLVVMRDRTFWVSDRHGPSLLHFDRTGRLLEDIGARTKAKRLPRVLANRRLDGGLAGLTLAPDGVTLLAIMRSPLDNPRQAGRASRLTRIVTFDTRSGTAKEFL